MENPFAVFVFDILLAKVKPPDVVIDAFVACVLSTILIAVACKFPFTSIPAVLGLDS